MRLRLQKLLQTSSVLAEQTRRSLTHPVCLLQHDISLERWWQFPVVVCCVGALVWFESLPFTLFVSPMSALFLPLFGTAKTLDACPLTKEGLLVRVFLSDFHDSCSLHQALIHLVTITILASLHQSHTRHSPISACEFCNASSFFKDLIDLFTPWMSASRGILSIQNFFLPDHNFRH